MTRSTDREVTEGELIALLDAYREHWKKTEDHILKLLRDLRDPDARLRIENHEPGSPEDLAMRKRFGLEDGAS